MKVYTMPASKTSISGQVAVLLLLFVLVALTIGLAVTQRSLTNITTSNQTEQVSRAFSAAEAGIESIKSVGVTAAGSSQTIPSTDLKNQSQAQARVLTKLPKSASNLGQTSGQALEYPPIGKDVIAQFWLANPAGTNWNSGVTDENNAQFFYGGNAIDVYYGDNQEPSNLPALEVNLISFNGTNYLSSRTFYDSDATRRASNGFSAPTSCPIGGLLINTSNSNSATTDDRQFICFARIPLAGTPIMIRARIIYSNIKQPIAVRPVANGCPDRCSLPFQAGIYTSTGTAGQSQKTLQVFKETNFMPSFLDFAIFSSGSIEKTAN